MAQRDLQPSPPTKTKDNIFFELLPVFFGAVTQLQKRRRTTAGLLAGDLRAAQKAPCQTQPCQPHVRLKLGSWLAHGVLKPPVFPGTSRSPRRWASWSRSTAPMPKAGGGFFSRRCSVGLRGLSPCSKGGESQRVGRFNLGLCLVEWLGF